MMEGSLPLYLIFSLLPILGLIVPFSYPAAIANAAAFGLIEAGLGKNLGKWKWITFGIILFIYWLIYSIKWPSDLTLFATGTFLVSFLSGNFINRLKKRVVAVVLIILVGGLYFSAMAEGKQVLAELTHDPGTEYTTDMRGFLKTYYLMRSGGDFYSSFNEGMKIAFHGDDFAVDIAGWRQPFIFDLWERVPGNGSQIYWLGITLLSGALVASYFMAKKFLPPSLALVAPIFLWPYFHYPLVDLSILQPEWWGMGFFLIGLTWLFYRHNFLAAGFFLMAMLTRMVYFLPVGLICLIILLAKRGKQFRWLGAALVIFLFHYLVIYLPQVFKFHLVLFSGSISGNIIAFRSALAFSSWNYVFGPFQLLLVLSFLTFPGLLAGLKQKSHQLETLILLTIEAAIIGGILLAAYTGRMSKWNDYWGIYFIPLIIISFPIATKFLVERLIIFGEAFRK